MTKHLHVLRQFIQHGRVSLHATALPGFDDVPGFAGVQLNDAYAQQFFLNQCLYLAKDMAAYVTVLRPGEFLVPRTSSQETNGEGVARAERSVVSQLLVQFEKASANVSTGARGSALHPSPSTPTTNTASSATAHCSFVLRAGSIPSSTAHSSSVAAPGPAPGPAGVIAGPLEVYGIEDPPSVFGGWGPGESSWSKGTMLFIRWYDKCCG